MLGDTRELSKVFFENVTVKPVATDVGNAFAELVEQVQLLKEQHRTTTELEEEIESRLIESYGLSAVDKAAIRSHESA